MGRLPCFLLRLSMAVGVVDGMCMCVDGMCMCASFLCLNLGSKCAGVFHLAKLA